MGSIETLTYESVRKNRKLQFPITYAYEYVKGLENHRRPELKLNEYVATGRLLNTGADEHKRYETMRSSNGIDIHPLEAGLPWATSIKAARQRELNTGKIPGSTFGGRIAPLQRDMDEVLCLLLARGKTNRSPTQALIDKAMQELHDEDRRSGNDSGAHVVEQLIVMFTHDPPPQHFNNMKEFLDFRTIDAGAGYALASTLFSINSSVDVKNPKLTRILRLFGEHIAVSNDLASWAKEKRAYDEKKVLYLINTVAAVKNLFATSSNDSAVQLTYAFQLEIEKAIDNEIQRLMTENSLNSEEWRFIDAGLHLLGGQALGSCIISRYGGESTKLPREEA
ncbi:hypothetical protein FE257_007836 [Aspergillus nanangensis]|uniref:Uncharacterized protein n=1 Tax=Aspergillus nanangensis TaxID=2582783 RepID=A0AAD4CYV2_ASPNN|nr:hypothetical protein FE257_007836 [Aspergillus nanangensis]